MNILITGAAGFIGAAVFEKLACRRHNVLGIDNLNSYYSPDLKLDRLANIGFSKQEIIAGKECKSTLYDDARFKIADITDSDAINSLMERGKFDIVVHLAAQAGVRYSLENPHSYVKNNVLGFLNILEGCRFYGNPHLVYASSSSVYGANTKVPYAESDRVDAPVSLYAATKRADELMAHCYNATFGLKSTGLRFFTVYGPWGRPDMAPMIFLKAISNGDEIALYNHGDMKRDFTYIEDVAAAVVKIAEGNAPEKPAIYNVGHSSPVDLLDFLHNMEKASGKKARFRMEPMQPGDVTATWADCSHIKNDYGIEAPTPLNKGLTEFCNWYSSYYDKSMD